MTINGRVAHLTAISFFRTSARRQIKPAEDGLSSARRSEAASSINPAAVCVSAQIVHFNT
jgi:hypothetical protein